MEKRKDATTAADSKAESAGTPGRDAEATSSETLSDVEDNEKVSTGGSGSGDGGALEGSSPKPTTEGGGGRADGSDTGGPM